MRDISNYKKIKENAESFYKKIGRVNCPAFNHETVYELYGLTEEEIKIVNLV